MEPPILSLPSTPIYITCGYKYDGIWNGAAASGVHTGPKYLRTGHLTSRSGPTKSVLMTRFRGGRARTSTYASAVNASWLMLCVITKF